MTNETHNPELKSWVESANSASTDFPIQNLPLGVFMGGDKTPHIGVAIGDQILDLAASADAGLLANLPTDTVAACSQPTLNSLMSLGQFHWSALRRRVSEVLRLGSSHQPKAEACLVPMRNATMCLPAEIGDYTDFYASIHHATNVGSMFRPDNPLFPNYKFVPIGYHGRSSSIAVSGTSVRRPLGQTQEDAAKAPSFGPSRSLDYELEVGLFVGTGNRLGEPIGIRQAGEHMFGVCLLNDWSARDIQKWEYQPLGPFLAKNFATSLSPWVITVEALAPFRVPAFNRSGDPAPLPYLDSEDDRKSGGFDIILEVFIATQRMRDQSLPPHILSRGRLKDMYWTFAQMLTHHASNGCNLCSGDLIGSGTVSGNSDDSRGCLLELSSKRKIQLPTGEVRRFLEDGDEVIMRGFCERKGYARIGIGECRGMVTPAKPA